MAELTDAQKAKLLKLGQLATFKAQADNAYYHDLEYDATNKKIVKKYKEKENGVWTLKTADVVSKDTLKEDLGINALVAAGGEPNVIESVKVNGTALTPASKAVDVKIELVEKSSANTGYLKTYQLKVNDIVQTTEIDIPKDLVVTSGSVVAGTWSNNAFTESAQGTGKALKLGIANQADPVYINVADLCDVYTPNNASGAKVTIAIDANNGISASITAGSIEKADLTSAVQALLDKADSAYQLPSGGITTSDLSAGVVASLGKADSALQAADITGKAEKSEMAISNVTGDATKKNIQLKSGLSQDVLVAHQDISGKADAATTLAGYGITDAKIESGVITLGSNTITPVEAESGKRLMSDAEGTKLGGIATGAQVNVIETVKVNNTPLTVTSKAVNIDLSSYAQTSDFTYASDADIEALF